MSDASSSDAISPNIPLSEVFLPEFWLADAVLVSGEASGDLLRLDRPISFWGGVDPRTGSITDPRHPQHGQNVAGKILAMERAIGSSSGSSVLLELLATGRGPAGLLLVESDAILTLGAIVAREMGFGAMPVFLISPTLFAALPPRLHLDKTGRLEPL